MKTEFSLAQLADPDIAEADKILRACVHCGFCTATCPTYVLLGDELDSPRGRIYLIKEMLEKDQAPTAEVVKHVDRCLSCLSCMTTCPSGVNYMHLVDQARVRIEQRYQRPLAERLLRQVLAFVLPDPQRFRISMQLARLARPLAVFLPTPRPSATPGLIERLKAMLALAPGRLPAPGALPGSVFAALGKKRGRVALLQGCAQQVLAPRINEAAISLLTRHGIEVVLVKDEQCCGALTHHLGHDDDALGRARANVTAWQKEAAGEGLDAILVDGVRLRHGDQGLRLSAARGRRVRRRCGEGIRACEGHHRIRRGSRARTYRATGQHRRRLPLSVFVAARAENHAPSERIAFQEWIRGERCPGEPFVLRFGGDLQHSPARACGPVARSQGRQHRERQAGHDCRRQYRLHGADCQWHVSSGRTHD
ncbi:heterodisulfide reductase subunit C [Bradyrhizobium sp. GM24.11]